MSAPVRWGILSTAKIGVEKVIPATQRAHNCEVVALASRNATQARAVCDRLGIERSYGNYDDLLADPDVDAIYNPLPNHLHVEWTLKALAAGKHVLCEKPIGLDVAQAKTLLTESARYSHLKVMEAFMYRHHPQWVEAKRLVNSSGLGELVTVQSLFSYFNREQNNIRNQADIGGGGLMDIGCYPISLSRWLFAAEPTRVLSQIEYDPEFQIDRHASAVLDFDGKVATFTCSTQMAPYQRVNIVGTQGRYEIEIPFNAPPDQPCRAWLQRAGQIDEISFPICDQYTRQAELFAQAILENQPVPTPLSDAVANMQVIEALFESHQKNNWIELDARSLERQ